MASRNSMIYWVHCLFVSPWNACGYIMSYLCKCCCTVRTAGNNNRFPAYLRLGLPQCSYILETDCTCLCLIVCEDKLWCVVCVCDLNVRGPKGSRERKYRMLESMAVCLLRKNETTVICTESILSPYLLYASKTTSQLLFSLLLLLLLLL
jgi:hypothetical protein